MVNDVTAATSVAMAMLDDDDDDAATTVCCVQQSLSRKSVMDWKRWRFSAVDMILCFSSTYIYNM